MRTLDRSENFKYWFESIYKTDLERLYRYAFSITKSKPLAEDVVSEIFTTVWNSKPQTKSIDELKAYLYASVKHQAIKMISRNENRISQLSQTLTLNLVESVNPEKLLIGKELSAIINEVIDNLPPHTQLVYKMVMNSHCSYQEISEELGISKRTVEKHMTNALHKLRMELNRHLESDSAGYSFLRKASSFTFISSLICYSIIKFW